MVTKKFTKSSDEGMQPKEFKLEDIISTYYRVAASPKCIYPVYEIIDFMAGKGIHTTEPQILDDLRISYIEEQFPEIKDIDPETLKNALENHGYSEEEKIQRCKEWVAEQAEKVGQSTVRLYNYNDWDVIKSLTPNQPSQGNSSLESKPT